MTKKKKFASPRALNALIAQYFDLEPELPTFSGLAYYLGFNSMDEFENYEARPRYGIPLKRAKLRIESIYEKKLHTHSYGGAVHALKITSRSEKPNHSVPETGDNSPPKVEIIHSGIVPAAYEKEVIL